MLQTSYRNEGDPNGASAQETAVEPGARKRSGAPLAAVRAVPKKTLVIAGAIVVVLLFIVLLLVGN